MSAPLKPLVVVPDGVGVRNFVLGRFLQQLSEQSEATVVHGIPEQLLPQYRAAFDKDVRWERLDPYAETPLTSTLRYALSYAQMYWVNTHSMRFNLRAPVRGSWRTRSVHALAKLLGRAAASPRGIRWLDQRLSAAVMALPIVDAYRRAFQALTPTVLFCSHQRPPVVLPA